RRGESGFLSGSARWALGARQSVACRQGRWGKNRVPAARHRGWLRLWGAALSSLRSAATDGAGVVAVGFGQLAAVGPEFIAGKVDAGICMVVAGAVVFHNDHVAVHKVS